MRPVVCPSRRGARAALVAAVLVAAPAAHAQQPIFTPDRADGIYAAQALAAAPRAPSSHATQARHALI
jgi:hypothetical protein